MSNIMFVISGLLLCYCWIDISLGEIPVFHTGENNNEKYIIKTEVERFVFPDELDLGQLSTENYDNIPYHHHYQHHHGHPDFFHRDYEYNDHHYTNTSKGADARNNADRNTTFMRRIPLEFIQNINEYNVSHLLSNFVEGDENEMPIIQDRFNNENERVTATITPKGAACMPELTTIKLVSNPDPSVLYIPQCTRIERCGGCCSHGLLSCQPQDKEYINFKVIKTQYTGGQKLKLIGKEVVAVERHTKCKCDCRIQPQDCNKFQVYKKSECRCACTNSDEEKKCYKNNNTKLWNPDVCVCQCRETMQCSTGSYFDQNDCKCAPIPVRRRGVDSRKYKRYEETFPVVPLNDEN